ncbi:MAG: fumarylacetoacetate hydrolase family protein [Armatimonadetes bacterium]|nr:fumarylacetoacetate hydrolase family protein [Armatimonadota bacterium]
MDNLVRLVSYVPVGESSDPKEARLGLLVDDRIVLPEQLFRAAEVHPQLEEPVQSVVAALTSSAYLDAARQALAWLANTDERTLAAVSLAREAVKLLAPVPKPNKVFALAGNYMEHIQESTQKKLQSSVSKSDEATPRVFMKPPSVTVCGDGDPILLGPSSRWPDYEAEMALIIGRAGRFLEPDEAVGHVAGITCLNDVSERELKIWDRPETREWDRFFDWLNGKWFDNAAPMGPCAVPVEDVGDIHALKIRLWLNGELKQDATTAQMIFRADRIVSYISQICTLEPGDIIATGTPSGVGHAQGIRLQDGDVVEVEIEKVGRLTNPVKQL